MTARAPTTAVRDVVFAFSYTDWSAAVARELTMPEDRLADALRRSPHVRRLLVCDPFRSVAARLARRALGAAPAAFPATDRARLHSPSRLRREDPTSPRTVARTVRAYERGVRRAAERLGMERPAVIVAHPLVAGLGDFSWAGPVTYYGWDDWSAFEPHRRWWGAYARAFERMRERGRRVCAISSTVLERVGSPGPSALVPNGVDPAEWLEPDPPPGWMDARPRPRLLYVGTLDGRVDVDRVRSLAASRPRWSLTLVGALREPGRYAPLRGLAGVELRAAVPRREVAAAIAGADACLIPHRRTRMTEAMSPLKLYEYLAGGRPVVATELPGIADLRHPGVELVPPGAELAPAVERALERGPADEERRRAFVAEHSWERRFERLLDLALAPDPEDAR